MTSIFQYKQWIEDGDLESFSQSMDRCQGADFRLVGTDGKTVLRYILTSPREAFFKALFLEGREGWLKNIQHNFDHNEWPFQMALLLGQHASAEQLFHALNLSELPEKVQVEQWIKLFDLNQVSFLQDDKIQKKMESSNNQVYTALLNYILIHFDGEASDLTQFLSKSTHEIQFIDINLILKKDICQKIKLDDAAIMGNLTLSMIQGMNTQVMTAWPHALKLKFSKILSENIEKYLFEMFGNLSKEDSKLMKTLIFLKEIAGSAVLTHKMIWVFNDIFSELSSLRLKLSENSLFEKINREVVREELSDMLKFMLDENVVQGKGEIKEIIEKLLLSYDYDLLDQVENWIDYVDWEWFDCSSLSGEKLLYAHRSGLPLSTIDMNAITLITHMFKSGLNPCQVFESSDKGKSWLRAYVQPHLKAYFFNGDALQANDLLDAIVNNVVDIYSPNKKSEQENGPTWLIEFIEAFEGGDDFPGLIEACVNELPEDVWLSLKSVIGGMFEGEYQQLCNNIERKVEGQVDLKAMNNVMKAPLPPVLFMTTGRGKGSPTEDWYNQEPLSPVANIFFRSPSEELSLEGGRSEEPLQLGGVGLTDLSETRRPKAKK